MTDASDAQPIGNANPRPCAECGLCCKLPPIRELDKPEGQWCVHFAKGLGCQIRPTRPGSCSTFQCLWSVTAAMDESWRPDRCKFFVRQLDTGWLSIEVDPGTPDAWKREPFYSQIKAWSRRPARPYEVVMVRTNGRLAIVFPDGEIDIGPAQPGMRIDSGYEMREGRMQSFARFADPSSPIPV